MTYPKDYFATHLAPNSGELITFLTQTVQATKDGRLPLFDTAADEDNHENLLDAPFVFLADSDRYTDEEFAITAIFLDKEAGLCYHAKGIGETHGHYSAPVASLEPDQLAELADWVNNMKLAEQATPEL